MELNFSKYNPLRASSFIHLPASIKKRNAVVNVRNQDYYCFAWSAVAAVCKPEGPEWDPRSYPHFTQIFNFDGIEFPVRLDSLNIFEKLNNASVNVYGIEKLYQNGQQNYEIVGPLYYTRCKKPIHINLLLISDDDSNQHYCTIKDLSKLVSSQITKRNGKKHLCDGCLQYFRTRDLLELHCKNDCGYLYVRIPNTDPIKNKIGKMIPGNILEFSNFQKQIRVPFVIYADFECLLKPLDNCLPDPEKSWHLKTYKHEPYSCGYYLKCSFDNNISKFCLFRGKQCIREFLDSLENEVKVIYDTYLNIIKPMHPLTAEQESEYAFSNTCYICERPFTSQEAKVKDHCHLTGQYRGPSHSTCNLNFKLPNFIPVFFHNLTNYDSHLFIKQLSLNGEDIDVIAKTKEKYITFSKHIHVGNSVNAEGKEVRKYIKLRFVDSLRFLPTSLEKLAKTLSSSECTEIRKYYMHDEEFDLIRQKGVFPYSFIDDWSKLDLTHLPDKDDFFDKLKEEHISDADYERAQKVWDVFDCNTLGDYSDIYLKSDILLLADIFENFRNTCFKHYGLDSAQYITAPSFSWDAMLKYTKVQLELLTEIDMLHFFKKGIRGGVSTCVKRWCHANNKFLPEYNLLEPSSFILYLDATNLYGYAMKQYLPTGSFEWLTRNEIENFNLNELSDTSDFGYILEVDLIYPETLHSLHNDMPFCPENIIPPHGKHAKLIPNLCDKTNYIIHYRNLKQCLKHGLIINNIHRILKFKQSPWLQNYINLNTMLRNRATSKFVKDLFKLLVNCIYGKTMENVEKRSDIKLSTHWANRGHKVGAETWIAKPHFKSREIFCDNLIAIEMNKVQVTYNKPIYAGFCILEMSKTVIYEFFYDFLKPSYGDNVSLLYTDTDSLVLQVFSENVYEDIKRNSDRFDTSNYPPNNIHSIEPGISVIGKMKDEYAGAIIKSFYGTGAKAYCIELLNKIEKKAKGISKHVVDKQIRFSDYKNVVTENSILLCSMNIFKSCLHEMFTERRNKIALSGVDDKRFLLTNSPNTLAWGHKDIAFHINFDTFLNELNKACEDNV